MNAHARPSIQSLVADAAVAMTGGRLLAAHSCQKQTNNPAKSAHITIK
jgi:hypothetical protein